MAKLPTRAQFMRATKTEAAIDAAILSDGGNRFRELLLKHLPRIEDAYRQDDETDAFRSHLGASLIGRACARELWMAWRWTNAKSFPARILRLFNRGHMEEARFLALLEMIDVYFHQPDDGGQERISDHGGHFGSALDGVLWNVPDAPGEWILGEFKTHNTKSFCKLVVDGVQAAKPEHYAQIQTCMARRGIFKTLYMAVNKNDDDIFCQIITFDPAAAQSKLDLAADIITRRTPPPRISDDPSNFACSMCDFKQRCHFPDQQKVLVNCRTCKHSVADLASGTWGCELYGFPLTKEMQRNACEHHDPIPALLTR